MNALQWLREQLTKERGRFLLWPVFVLALAAAYYLGTLGGPERVEERFSYVEVKAKTVQTAKAKNLRTYTKTVKTPDGTITRERSTVDVGTENTTTTETSSVADVRERVVTVPPPSWSVGALVAATWREPTPAPSGVTFGPFIDFRLGKLPCHAGGVGLLEVRAGAVTAGSLGVTGRCEFK